MAACAQSMQKCNGNTVCDSRHYDRFKTLVDLCIVVLSYEWSPREYKIKGLTIIRRHGWNISYKKRSRCNYCDRCLLDCTRHNSGHCLYWSSECDKIINNISPLDMWLKRYDNTNPDSNQNHYICQRCRVGVYMYKKHKLN